MPNLFDSNTINILLAEDNPFDVELLKSAMSLADWEIPFQLIVCSDGKNLLEYLIIHPTRKIDIAVLDINMPNLDGITTLKMIRKHPKWSRLPVILYSSIETTKYLRECYQAGGDDFFEKPLDPKGYRGLVSKIQKIVTDRMQNVAV
jgi:CheY-like chemotaxis protein